MYVHPKHPMPLISLLRVSELHCFAVHPIGPSKQEVLTNSPMLLYLKLGIHGLPFMVKQFQVCSTVIHHHSAHLHTFQL